MRKLYKYALKHLRVKGKKIAQKLTALHKEKKELKIFLKNRGKI